MIKIRQLSYLISNSSSNIPSGNIFSAVNFNPTLFSWSLISTIRRDVEIDECELIFARLLSCWLFSFRDSLDKVDSWCNEAYSRIPNRTGVGIFSLILTSSPFSKRKIYLTSCKVHSHYFSRPIKCELKSKWIMLSVLIGILELMMLKLKESELSECFLSDID